MRPYLERTHHKKRAGGMLKVKALSSSPNNEKIKRYFNM
jgi:hypothetical protein